MAVYVLHIAPPYHHASHYIGYTSRPVGERVGEHLASRGSPLIAAALAAGHEVMVARKWHCGTRQFERYLKNFKSTPKLCPHCSPRPKRVTFAGFARFVMRGGFVRPSRRYYAIAAHVGVSVTEVLAMNAAERRAIDEDLKSIETRIAA